MDSDTPIRFDVTLTFEQYLAYQRVYLRRQFRFLRPIAYLSLICFVFAPAFPLEGNPSLPQKYVDFGTLLILPGLIFVLAPSTLVRGARKRWAATGELQETQHYELTDRGISVTGDSFRAHTDWKYYRRAETAGDMILLWAGQPIARIIPVAALGTSENVEAFKTLLRSKVPDCKRL